MRAREFLLEYSRQITAQKVGPQLLQKFEQEPASWQARVLGGQEINDMKSDRRAPDTHYIDALLTELERADPTRNKQYMPWIARVYLTSPELKFEDAVTKPYRALEKFYNLVQRRRIQPPNNDINRIKSFDALEQIVAQFPDEEEKPQEANRGDASLAYEDNQLRIIVPNDRTAACYYGQGTKWCTAAREHNMFDNYRKSGVMYIILPKKPAYVGEKYQFHFESRQFMNEKDQQVNMRELVARYPQLADIFDAQAKEYGILALQKGVAGSYDIIVPKIVERLPRAIVAATDTARNQGLEVQIMNHLGFELPMFSASKNDENFEIARELLEDFFDNYINKLSTAVARIVEADPDVVYDEDSFYQEFNDVFAHYYDQSEFAMFMEEVAANENNEDIMYEAAMSVQGDVMDLFQKILPKVFTNIANLVKQEVLGQ